MGVASDGGSQPRPLAEKEPSSRAQSSSGGRPGVGSRNQHLMTAGACCAPQLDAGQRLGSGAHLASRTQFTPQVPACAGAQAGAAGTSRPRTQPGPSPRGSGSQLCFVAHLSSKDKPRPQTPGLEPRIQPDLPTQPQPPSPPLTRAPSPAPSKVAGPQPQDGSRATACPESQAPTTTQKPALSPKPQLGPQKSLYPTICVPPSPFPGPLPHQG